MTEEERLNLMIYGTSHPEIYKTARDEEIERLRAENEKLREALKTVCLGVVAERENLDWFIMDGAALRVARAAIRDTE